MPSNSVRISGGRWRSRQIHFPPVPQLRPTSDFVRQALFNWLGQSLEGFNCLDLYAGSGVLGFEALSRGASNVVMVDSDPRVVQALRRNAQKLAADGLEIRRHDALRFVAADKRRYDVIFLDPPFDAGVPKPLLRYLPARLATQGLVYVESGAEWQPGTDWTVWKKGQAGGVHYQLLRWNLHD
ncbi:MAG: 16S rRNA (guanine(966)-N(2))-methyltransferase RsmD [Burkholderiales bacterium]